MFGNMVEGKVLKIALRNIYFKTKYVVYSITIFHI